MKKWLVFVFVMLSFSCYRFVLGKRTHSSVDAHSVAANITDIKMDVCVMKENYITLLQRVVDNEHEIAFLKGQKQQLENELEKTRRTFSCEIESLHDLTIQQKLELNDTIHCLTTFNKTSQDLIHRVNVLDNKCLLPEKCREHNNKSDSYINCVGGWMRRADFCAFYCFSNNTLSWDDAQEECRLQNGWLADIYSENEAKWLAEYSRTHLATSVWIGGKRNSYGIYEWITSKGETRGMDYTRWAPYEPKMYGGQCVDLWRKHEYKWDDTHCAFEFNFICKIYS